MISLRKALLLDEQGVVSLVGAGGKTSLMFKLAREISEAGETVLTTTTTKILKPTPRQSSNLIISDGADTIIDTAGDLLNHNHLHVTVAASQVQPEKKLFGLQPQTIDVLSETKLFRWIIVEADGAARKPLKAPADHEPVIPESTTQVVGICGLSGIGKPLTEKWVHRSERFAEITGLTPGAKISEAALGAVLIHENGIFKNTPLPALRTAFLNQADVPGAREAGEKVVDLLRDKQQTGLNRIIIGQMNLTPPVLAVYDLNP